MAKAAWLKVSPSKGSEMAQLHLVRTLIQDVQQDRRQPPYQPPV